MLQTLRSGAAGWVAKVFLGLLVLSFGIWGIADVFRIGGSAKNVAVIGDRSISVDEFRNAYAMELRRIGQQAKRVITPEQARMAGVGERVLGNLVNEAAIDARVSSLGLSVSDEEVAREIQNDEVFRGPTGGFDRTTFNEILRQNNLSENTYLNLQRTFTARKQLTDALSGGMEPPVALRQALHAYEADSRSVSYVELKPEAAASVPAPTPEQLKAFYDERKLSFRLPEYRKVAVVALDAQAIAAGIKVSDDEIRAYYDSNRPSYSDLEKRSIEQVVFPSVAEAKDAYERIKAGAPFEQIMLQRKMKPEDAYLGDLTKSQMLDATIADAAFALKQGEVSEPVEGAYSVVLLRVTGIQQEHVKPFEDVRDDIRAAIAGGRAAGEVKAIHDKIDDARLGGATLDEVAKTNNLQLRVIDAVDREGRGPDGAEIPDLPQKNDLLSKIFATDPGADTAPVGGPDSFAWFDVRGVTPPRERAFEDARTEVEARWREDEARKRLDARTEAVLAELRTGGTLDKVAAEQKASVEQAETTRSGGAPSIKPAQATKVFQTPVEGFGATAADETGSRLVFKVTSVNDRPYDPATAGPNEQADRITQTIANDLVTAFVQKLRQDLGTRFDGSAITQVTGSGAS